jgi:transposase-like protein
MRKSYSGNFKAKVAVEVIREQDTLAEISSKFEVHRALLTRWKKEALEGLPELFSKKTRKNDNNDKQLIDNLYKQIGQLKVENDWLKKKVETINR